MKFNFMLLLSAFTLFSCATGPLPQFSKTTNCSPRALEHIANKPTLELNGMASIEAFKVIHSCSHDQFEAGNGNQHNVCLVMSVTESGGFNFIDVADYNRPMSSELHKCILDKIQKIDFIEYKNHTVLQPLRVE